MTLAVMLCLIGSSTTSPLKAEASDKVPPIDPAAVNPEMFDKHESIWARHLVHLPELANSVVMEGENRGFIALPVWRSLSDNQPHNARVLENHMSLAFFYTVDRPWNPYRGNPALRERLEAVLDFWCKIQNEDGRFSEYRPEGWALSSTAFGIKFMGETLRLLNASQRSGGPTIDPVLHKRTTAAARRAIEALLTHPDLIAQGRQFSNQYTGFWGGTMALLSAHDDSSLRRRLTARIREVRHELTSPAGYHYENHGCDWAYTLGTHRNNLRHAWNYARGSELGSLLVDMERPWVEWLSYNAVREPDGSFFTLNRAIETRTGSSGFRNWDMPLAEALPLARAFAFTPDEFESRMKMRQQQLVDTWPDFGQLTSYAPHVFVDQIDRHRWHPTQAERAAAIASLPYLARNRFVHQRVDSRIPMSSTYIRRPAYYAAFNAGEKVAEIQRYGLGLLWNPQMGSVLQAQSKNKSTWGTARGMDLPYEARAFQPVMRIDGRAIDIQPGVRDFPSGESMPVFFDYDLGDMGKKTIVFGSDRISVRVVHSGSFTECFPLLLRHQDELVLEDGIARLHRDNHSLEITFPPGIKPAAQDTSDYHYGPFRVVQLKLEAKELLEYHLAFK
jgi:hypothetical protein